MAKYSGDMSGYVITADGWKFAGIVQSVSIGGGWDGVECTLELVGMGADSQGLPGVGEYMGVEYTTTTTGTTLGNTEVGDAHHPYIVRGDYSHLYVGGDSVNEESDEMTKDVEYVYIPYAINQRTKETWEGDRMTGKDYTATLQRAILDNAYNINMLGDSDDIYVWLGEVGEFEPIE